MQLSVFEIITLNSWRQQWIASRYLSQLENGKQSHEKLQVILPKPEGFGEVLQYHKRNMDNYSDWRTQQYPQMPGVNSPHR